MLSTDFLLGGKMRSGVLSTEVENSGVRWSILEPLNSPCFLPKFTPIPSRERNSGRQHAGEPAWLTRKSPKGYRIADAGAQAAAERE